MCILYCWIYAFQPFGLPCMFVFMNKPWMMIAYNIRTNIMADSIPPWQVFSLPDVCHVFMNTIVFFFFFLPCVTELKVDRVNNKGNIEYFLCPFSLRSHSERKFIYFLYLTYTQKRMQKHTMHNTWKRWVLWTHWSWLSIVHALEAGWA